MQSTIKFIVRITFILISASATAQYTKLTVFTGPNGFEPWGSLITDGTYLYGLTSEGGANNYGTIFKIRNDGTDYVKLLDFAGTTNGAFPYGSLFSDGTFLYGMTANGGTTDDGTIFKIMPDGTGFVKLFDFDGTATGSEPFGSLISDGTYLYGMTLVGGTGNLGTIFKILKDGSGYVKLFDFTGTANGSQPYGDLLLIGSTLYGTTYAGGSSNKGIIFRIQTDGTNFGRLMNFSGSPAFGERPMGSLVSDGTFLYGMTSAGGSSNDGTIFRVRLDIGVTTTIKNFRLEQGDLPTGSLIVVGTELYGMTYRGGSGGTHEYGTLFKIKSDGSGHVKLFDFNTVDKGWLPNGSLILDGTFLYGMTQQGGDVSGGGVVFKYELPKTPTITSFTATSGPVGTSVTITGTNFSDTPENNQVHFDGWPATVTASTATSITATVPPAAATGRITVTVLGNTGTSATDFTVIPGAAAIHKFDWVDPLVGSLDTFLNGMTTDPSGNVFTVGSFSETTDFDPGDGEFNLTSAGNFDGFICKYTRQGELEWAFRFGDVDTDNATAVASDADGNIYVTGTFSGNSGDLDPGAGVTIFTDAFSGFICKYNTHGDLIWALQTETNLVSSVDMAATATEVFVASGYSGTVDFDPGAGVFNMTANGISDAFILKLSLSGDFIWARGVGGPMSEVARGVAVDDNGNVHITGFFSGTADFDPGAGTANLTAPTTASDAYILKLNSSGDYLWAKNVGGGNPGATDSGEAIDVDNDGNVLITGTFNGTGDFDPGAPVVTLASEGAADIFVLKLDAAGNFVWVRSIGGSSGDLGYGIKTDAAGNVYYSGDYGRTVDFDPGPGTYVIEASTGTTINDHAFVSKLDPDGNFIWAWSTSGSPAFAEIPLLSLDANEDIILAGTFELGTVDFDPGDCVNAITAGTGVGSYITRLSTTATSSCTPSEPVVVFTLQPSSKSACAGPITFTVVATGDDNLVYQWQIDNGGYVDLSDDATYSDVTTATLTILNPASSMDGSVYRVVVHGDNTSDTPSSDATLTISTPPGAPIASDPDPVCPSSTVTLTATGSSDGNYRWYNGTTLIPEELNGTYVVTMSNVSATYGVTIHDGTCESAIALIVVTVTDCDPPKPSELVVYNAVSPNGDGMNDVFFIENIGDLTAAGDNKVVIYNRWGDVVFEANNYDNAITVFKGLNRNGNELPTGTYYYRIEIAGSESMTGYISLKR